MVTPFYQSIHYEPIRDRRVNRTLREGSATLSKTFPHIRTQILEYFQERSFERLGILHGDYILHDSGIMLVNAEGFVTAACVSIEDRFIVPWLTTSSRTFESEDFQISLSENWSLADVALRNCPILCDPYEANYFHFSLELVPRLRYFPSLSYQPVVTSKIATSRQFHRDLWRRCVSQNNFHVLDKYIKVRDPIISHDVMSEEGIFWLRNASKIAANTGKRRIYIRRSARGTRSVAGGGISETPAFLELLRANAFEIVEFGNGELGVAEQVERLEGAGLILAAHGASLANLTYLHGPLSVIEVIGRRTGRACFMHLASMLGFNYFGSISCEYDSEANVVVDVDELGAAIRRLL